MARKGIIKVVFDHNVVTVSGAEGAEVEVHVVGPPPAIVGNTIRRAWYERWWGILAIGVAVTVLGGGVVHALGWA
jgi:hypothetical protein